MDHRDPDLDICAELLAAEVQLALVTVGTEAVNLELVLGPVVHQEGAVGHLGRFVCLGEELDLEVLAEAFRIFEVVSSASSLDNDGRTDPFVVDSGHVGAFQDVALHAVDHEVLPGGDDIFVDEDALADDVLEYAVEVVEVHASDVRAWAGVHTSDAVDDDVVAAGTFRPCLRDQYGVPYDAGQAENLEVVDPGSDHGGILVQSLFHLEDQRHCYHYLAETLCFYHADQAAAELFDHRFAA